MARQRPASEMSDRERLGHLGKPTNAHQVLIKFIQEYGWQRGAEIGVLRGKTFFAMLDASIDLYLIGVDQWKVLPFREDECAETYQGFPMDDLMRDVMERAKAYGERARILHSGSWFAARFIDDASLDFVFIDGDHTERGLKQDLLAWAPKVKPKGTILGHDWSWPTVRRVLDRHCPGWQAHDEEVWSIPQKKVQL